MNTLAARIQAVFSLDIISVSRLSGGDIAQAYKVEAASGAYFAKIMSGDEGKKVLATETMGLKELRASGALKVPEVYDLKDLGGNNCLLMEYIPPGEKTPKAMESLGRGLAKMHSEARKSFGWPVDNYIGSLPQRNLNRPDWAGFYAGLRLQPLYKTAVDQGKLRPSEIPSFEIMEKKIRDGIPEVTPSLLHGDLWGGNYLISQGGDPYLIDPACYHGHSEVDLAMSRLFGGFSERFYGAYREILPDAPGWERRTGLYQLYYLLVHLILFGASYAPGVRQHTRVWFGG